MKSNKILKRKLKNPNIWPKKNKNNYERYSNLIPTWQLLRDLRRLGFDRYRCNNGSTIKERKKNGWTVQSQSTDLRGNVVNLPLTPSPTNITTSSVNCGKKSDKRKENKVIETLLFLIIHRRRCMY
jgi:hypothetical protein